MPEKFHDALNAIDGILFFDEDFSNEHVKHVKSYKLGLFRKGVIYKSMSFICNYI